MWPELPARGGEWASGGQGGGVGCTVSVPASGREKTVTRWPVVSPQLAGCRVGAHFPGDGCIQGQPLSLLT